PGSWAEAGGRASGGSPAPSEGEARPASRGRGRAAEQMEIGPLQRMAREPDVELFKGYHSYAVRTSPVTPATDYEEEQFPENEPPSPEPRGEPQHRAGTPGPPQGREEKPVVVAEAKAEAKAEPARPKELQQRPSPERRALGRAELVADRKTEARAAGRTEPKAGAKRGAAQTAAVVAAQKAEECEEGPNTIVICMVILLNIGLAILFVHFLT
ncbi:JPH2 protein, partial [Spelaeornis formosus]|nr:JPH2 protein [Elachura formosa]